MIMGPNSSGRSAASIMMAQPAWQLPMTQGFPSGHRLQDSTRCAAKDQMPKPRMSVAAHDDEICAAVGRVGQHGLCHADLARISAARGHVETMSGKMGREIRSRDDVL